MKKIKKLLYFFKKYLTLEEAIKAIVGEISKEQLKKLEFVADDGKITSFERHLYLKYKDFYCKYQDSEEIKEMFNLINKDTTISSIDLAKNLKEMFTKKNPDAKRKRFVQAIWGVVLGVFLSIFIFLIAFLH